jgi:NAD(P)H-hydrate repair Nnr-like enzyme with NAD(P)H-hydrate dehydratase domain
MVDRALYPILAASAGGIMVVPAGSGEPGGEEPPREPLPKGAERFRPDAVLLGPGWGRSPSRLPVLQKALDREAKGTPLILDADAITLSRN